MGRSPLRIDPDGGLALLESAVVKHVTDFLTLHQWLVYITNASDRARSGAPSHRKYTLDLIAIKAVHGWKEHPRVIFIELKRRKARTEKARLLGQTATAQALGEMFLVYQAPENHSDPIGHWNEWARRHGV